MKIEALIINNFKKIFPGHKLPVLAGKTIIFSYLLLFFPQFNYAQKAGYVKVLDQDEKVAGTFGEIRAGHFHSGTDYKTGEKEGLPVYAAADGYVVRVKVSSVGYGKALYINHPDSITTVYGHLRMFYDAIEDTITSLQNEEFEFEQELFPDSGIFPVKAGQLIGYSGNTGGSEGPHLHFETRNTHSERPYRPTRIGYGIPDTIPPTVLSVSVYEGGISNGLYGSTRVTIPVDSSEQDTFIVHGDFFIGFEGYDLAGTEPNKIGIRTYRLTKGDSLIYFFKIDEFSFDETRMINALIDYSFKQDSGKTIILCTRLPGNELSFLGPETGLIHLENGTIHSFNLLVEDGSGNTTDLNFIVHRVDSLIKLPTEVIGTNYLYGNPLNLEKELCRVKFPEKAFYENSIINFEQTEQVSENIYAPVFKIEPANLAVNKPIEISIQPDRINELPESKFLIAKIDSAGNLRSAGGKFEAGWVTSTIRSLGNYTVVIDTTSPIALTPHWKSDDLTLLNYLVIPVKDNLSGLSKYSCFINDEWVCAEYYASRSEIFVYFDHIWKPNTPFKLKVCLADQKDNSAEYLFEIDK